MSTRNITGMNPARRANAIVAESALARAEELAAEARRVREQRDQDVKNAQIAARALEQEANDQLAFIGEEVGQVEYIVKGDMEPAPAAPMPPVVDAPPVASPAQPEPAQVDRPEEPPAQPDAPTVVLDQTPEPQEAIGLPPAQEVPQPPHQLDPRGWNWLQWLLAILLGLFGLFIGLRTVEWVVSGWNVGWPDGLIVLIQVVFGFVWVIAFSGLGFFGGALLGFFIPRWRERRATHNDAVPPVPPANPPAA